MVFCPAEEGGWLFCHAHLLWAKNAAQRKFFDIHGCVRSSGERLNNQLNRRKGCYFRAKLGVGPMQSFLIDEVVESQNFAAKKVMKIEGGKKLLHISAQKSNFVD